MCYWLDRHLNSPLGLFEWSTRYIFSGLGSFMSCLGRSTKAPDSSQAYLSSLRYIHRQAPAHKAAHRSTLAAHWPAEPASHPSPSPRWCSCWQPRHASRRLSNSDRRSDTHLRSQSRLNPVLRLHHGD